MRFQFFGSDGDTSWNLRRLRSVCSNVEHHEIDIRDYAAIRDLVATCRPHLIVHCAAQPSHDLAKERPFEDFDINGKGTLNLLEAMRQQNRVTFHFHEHEQGLPRRTL